MATTVIKATGGHYATPQLWWADISTLGTLSAPEIGEMAAEEFNAGSLNMSGGTVVADATNRIILRAQAGAEPTSPLRYGTGARILFDGNEELLIVNKNFTTLENFAVKGSAASHSQFGYVRVDQRTDIRRLIIEHNKQGGLDDRGTNAADVRDNIVTIRTADDPTGWGVRIGAANSTFRNCTSVALNSAPNSTAFRRAYVAPIFINCVAYGYGTDWNSGFNVASSKNCATDKASGSSGIASVTDAEFSVPGSEFESTTNGSHDLRVKSTSTQLQDQGAGIGGTTTDIFGNTVRGLARDIGAHEYQAPIQINDNNFQASARGVTRGRIRGVG